MGVGTDGSRTKTLYLTVQLSIPFNLLVPKNKTERGPKIINRRVLLASPDSKNLPTLAAQLPKSLAPTDFTFALPFHSPAGPSARPLPVIRKGKMFFPPLDPARPLSETLRRTAWVEFPTIHVIPSQEWQERVKKGEVVIAPLLEPIVASEGRTRDAGWGAKRRAPTEMVGVGKKVKIGVEDVLAALGEYDSDEEEEEGEEVLGGKEGEVVLEALGRAAEADLGDD